jgi:hypothetical protein
MPWIAIWAGVAFVGTLGAWVNLQAARFERRVKREARSLFASIGDTDAPRVPLDAFPAPVRRYLEVSGAARRAPVAAVRLRHAGTFVPKPGASPLPIRGEQYLMADPPGFVWWGRIRMAPGLWIDGRDRAVGGEGNMLVKAASSITLSDASGPELDQGRCSGSSGSSPGFRRRSAIRVT